MRPALSLVVAPIFLRENGHFCERKGANACPPGEGAASGVKPWLLGLSLGLW